MISSNRQNMSYVCNYVDRIRGVYMVYTSAFTVLSFKSQNTAFVDVVLHAVLHGSR